VALHSPSGVLHSSLGTAELHSSLGNAELHSSPRLQAQQGSRVFRRIANKVPEKFYAVKVCGKEEKPI
ncbi:MAG: hypothetical protein IJU84_07920, partial [Clostridia bacterium]|nr:hypothetical protein [Clostridia bacterium]